MSKLRFTFDDAEVMEFLAGQESQFLESPTYFRDRVRDRLLLGVENFGDCLPWRKTMKLFRARPGEVTIWSGINGHGKSMVLGMASLWFLEVTKVCIASLEMTPESTIQRMLKQAAGTDSPSIEFLDRWLESVEGSLWVYDQLDSLPSDRVLAMCHYAINKLECKHIVIDSLMKCGIGEEDYQAQGDFVDKLCWIAKKYSVHIHLVHHMRKGRSEDDMPDKFDVKGASRITDMVDNLIIVHRNKSKERRLSQGKAVEELEPDTRLRIAKHRHGEWEGDIALYFDVPSQQYRSAPDSRQMIFNLERAAS